MVQYTNINEYLNRDSGEAGSLLFPKSIFDRLIEEVDKALIPRTEAAIFIGASEIPGSSKDINLEKENQVSVRKIAEGSSILQDDEEWENVNITPVKYGVGFRITSEFQEDNQFSSMDSRLMRKAGKRFAENETTLILTAIDAGASNTVSGGAAFTIANLTRMIRHLEDADYEGTSLWVGNEVMDDLRNIDTFVEANKVGNTDMITKGFQGVLYGLNVLRFSSNAAPSTAYGKRAYVTDRNEAYAIAEKRPITMKGFSIESHDMDGISATQRIGVAVLRGNAIVKGTTT